jgi:hypothetical protein
MQSQPGIDASHVASMRFASSELLKIETAFPTEGQTPAHQ